MAEIYAALQSQKGERPHETVWALMRASLNQGIFFKTLEVLGTLEIGNMTFVRFRTGHPELANAFSDPSLEDRAVIASNGQGYSLALPGGRQGNIPTAKMLMVADPNERRLYRGPAVKLWERQFLDI
jgi:hypothetical protein